MTWQVGTQDLAVLAVVPARGGSKGIPRKNLQTVGGLSLVGRATHLAASLAWIDETIVSTDDAEILNEAVGHGAAAPFLRPAKLSGDEANSEDVWRHAWLAAEEHYERRFDVSLLLEPTSPLRTQADLIATMTALTKDGFASAATVSRSAAHYTPHKALTIDGDGRLGFHMHNGAAFSRRQAIPGAVYHRNGLCYAATRAAVVDRGEIVGTACAAVIVDRPVVNIDDAFELELAEWLLARQQQRDDTDSAGQPVAAAQRA
ncbi:MAG: acylneuraminate cytidylyltransferase family protein [Alphaproteobacteria bacterium]|nr:acylneuraminate cytidylyltransferase family protein [Alphaproteobacteria bacterium]